MKGQQIVGIGEFRQRATELIKEVEESARSIVIARRGTPVAELSPVRSRGDVLTGSVMFISEVDLWAPVVDDGDWSAAR